MCLPGLVMCAVPLCWIRMLSDLTSYMAGTAETHTKQKGIGARSLPGIVSVGVIQTQNLKQRSGRELLGRLERIEQAGQERM